MLSQEQFEFIKKNSLEDSRSLALKTHTLHKESMGFLLMQIKQKQRVVKKLPSWHNNHRLLFANELSAEQCSSESTASFKSSLFSGKSMIDLTGGLGIDCLAFSKTYTSCDYIEMNAEVCQFAVHNFNEIGANNINVICADAVDFLKNSTKIYDLIYLDPDRRHNQARVYDFADSLPNVLEHLELLLSKTKQVLVKGSPMLNLAVAKNQLKYVSKIWVISHKNECKEILFLLEQNADACTIEAIELETAHAFAMDFDKDETSIGLLSEPKTYLYDPFVGFRKAEMANQINKKFGTLATLAPSISTSDEYINNFPGRCFKVLDKIAPTTKALKQKNIKRANIISRANSLDSNTLHSKLKLERGGDIFLIAMVHSKQKIELAICEKVF